MAGQGRRQRLNAIATILAAMLAVILAASAFAQGEVPAFCLATDPPAIRT